SDRGRIVNTRIGETRDFAQLLGAQTRDLHHVGLRAKLQTARWTGLNAGRFETLAHTIGTKRALVNLLRVRMKLRDIERTTGDAITTTDTVLLLKINDAVFVLDDRAVCRTRTQTARIFAVQTLVLPQQPHQVAVALVLHEFDQVVVVPLRRGHRLVGIVEGRLAKRMIVPFDASDFARLTTDAGRDIDVLADCLFTADAPTGHWTRMGRDFLNLKCAWISHRLCLF